MIRRPAVATLAATLAALAASLAAPAAASPEPGSGWLGVSAGWRALIMNQAADEPVDTLTLGGPCVAFNMNF